MPCHPTLTPCFRASSGVFRCHPPSSAFPADCGVNAHSACLRRVQALEQAGVIRGYRAVLDPVQLGIGFVAYVTVGLGSHTKAAQEAFERAVSRATEVRECHNITGTVEYLLRVEVTDLAAFKHWHTDILGTLPQVRAITTFVVMGSPKDDRA